MKILSIGIIVGEIIVKLKKFLEWDIYVFKFCVGDLDFLYGNTF